MFTVVTTKRQPPQLSVSRQTETKTVGNKSLDAMVSEAWAATFSLANRPKLPDGPGWRKGVEVGKEMGMSDSGFRSWFRRNADLFESCWVHEGQARCRYIRPKSLASQES